MGETLNPEGKSKFVAARDHLETIAFPKIQEWAEGFNETNGRNLTAEVWCGERENIKRQRWGNVQIYREEGLSEERDDRRSTFLLPGLEKPTLLVESLEDEDLLVAGEAVLSLAEEVLENLYTPYATVIRDDSSGKGYVFGVHYRLLPVFDLFES